MEIGLK